jgi:hypothetical protein
VVDHRGLQLITNCRDAAVVWQILSVRFAFFYLLFMIASTDNEFDMQAAPVRCAAKHPGILVKVSEMYHMPIMTIAYVKNSGLARHDSDTRQCLSDLSVDTLKISDFLGWDAIAKGFLPEPGPMPSHRGRQANPKEEI